MSVMSDSRISRDMHGRIDSSNSSGSSDSRESSDMSGRSDTCNTVFASKSFGCP